MYNRTRALRGHRCPIVVRGGMVEPLLCFNNPFLSRCSIMSALQVVESSKTAVQRHARKDIIYHGIRDCFSRIYKEAGMRGLYRGVGMFPTSKGSNICV